MHALQRTSPYGGPFLGTCIKCGQTDLPPQAVHQPCPKDHEVSDAKAIDVIMGKHDS